MSRFQFEILQVCFYHLAFGFNSIKELRFVRLFNHRFSAVNILSLAFNELSDLVTFPHETDFKFFLLFFQIGDEVVLFSVGECSETISFIKFKLFRKTLQFPNPCFFVKSIDIDFDYV